MFEYIVDTGLKWPRACVKRAVTDHIQIHHTVGDYSTPAKIKALHEKWQEEGDRGMYYSLLVAPDGTAYQGRGHEYKHGAVRNDWSSGAADRSVSIAYLADARNGIPEAAMKTLLRLTLDCMTLYKLTASAVLGHNEVPGYRKGEHWTECPVIDMDAFRGMLMWPVVRDLSLTSPMMRGDDVRAFQDRLVSLGYDIGKTGADGIYGPAADKAVRLLYERAAAVKPGVVDAAMRALMGL
ncbi:MAG TPA: N-acetylmuramoyl-L-alanine amidase [Feifaniaceae bacterium]|nr:N-acetylmuramoyl-L-alanine amidase [Feifaniaceae bacterium]